MYSEEQFVAHYGDRTKWNAAAATEEVSDEAVGTDRLHFGRVFDSTGHDATQLASAGGGSLDSAGVGSERSAAHDAAAHATCPPRWGAMEDTTPLMAGERVLGNLNGLGTWLPAEVARADDTPAGPCDLDYDAGHREVDVPRSRVRRPATKKRGAVRAGTRLLVRWRLNKRRTGVSVASALFGEHALGGAVSPTAVPAYMRAVFDDIFNTANKSGDGVRSFSSPPAEVPLSSFFHSSYLPPTAAPSKRTHAP
jgi:hypothetical protein